MFDRHIFCSECGTQGEAGCDCAAEYISAAAFAVRAIARNPEKSNRAIAEETGVSFETIRRARPTDTNVSVEPRLGLDGKTRKMPRKATRPATQAELVERGLPLKSERRIDLKTGEAVSWREATKREAVNETTNDLESEVIELKAEVARLAFELNQRPAMDDLRRLDAVERHVQRITTDIDTHNLLRRCLHPDSRNSVSDEMLHKAWLAFRNLEALTYDKSKIPAPMPADLNELWRIKEAAREARKRSRTA